MKKILHISAIVLLATMVFTSCTMEKRVYRPGFNVEWNQKDDNQNDPGGQTAVLNNTQQIQSQITNQTTVSPVEQQKNATPFLASTTKNNPPAEKTKHQVNRTVDSEPTAIGNSRTVQFLKPHTMLIAPFAVPNPGTKATNNQIIALILCFFLGMLGVHSFYLGNKKKGIIQLLMFIIGLILTFVGIGIFIYAALGIWVLIDFIRIIIGDLGPGW